jgi:hypothetical protein
MLSSSTVINLSIGDRIESDQPTDAYGGFALYIGTPRGNVKAVYIETPSRRLG